MQQDRRRNPYPYTGEIALAVALAVVVMLIMAVHAGAAAANLLVGNGAHWPAHSDLFTILPAILRGDSTAGMGSSQPAPPILLWVCIAIAETIAIAATAGALLLYQRRFGAGRIRGMATRAQAASLLGPARLRRVAHVVRPDLYGPRSHK